MIRSAKQLLAELDKGRSVARLDGMDATLREPRPRWAIVETGETVRARAVLREAPHLAVIQHDLLGEPMQYGAPSSGEARP